MPSKLVLAFASAGIKNTIPVPSQIGVTPGAASYTDGFPPLTMTRPENGGTGVDGLDMNGVLNGLSAVDVWMSAGGGFPYDVAFSAAIGGYPKGARVLMASGGGYWVSTADNNVTDPDTGGSGWAADDSNAINALTGDVTAAGPGSAAATLAASGVTAGSYTGANITVDSKGRVTAAANGSTHGEGSGYSAGVFWDISPSGLIHQFGTCPSMAPNSSGTVNLPISFSNTGYIPIIGQVRQHGGNAVYVMVDPTTLTVNSFGITTGAGEFIGTGAAYFDVWGY